MNRMFIAAWIAVLLVIPFRNAYPQTDPGVRNGHAMGYHEQSQCIVLFGGADEKQVLGDTWIISDSSIRKLLAAGPPPRTFANMVYNPNDSSMILFGGNPVLFGTDDVPLLFNDTWIFKNEHWSLLTPQRFPPPRSEASMAFDVDRNRVVLFGGLDFDRNRNIVRLGDTWEFDGVTWTKVATDGPSPRSGSVMVYNREMKKSILIGGNISLKKDAAYGGPVWTWDGRRWEQLSTNLPLIYNACASYNPDDKTYLIFGGWDGQSRLNDTWKCTGGNCKPVNAGTPAPPKRNHAALIYDTSKHAFNLFGGHDGAKVYGDLWTYNNNAWKLIIDRPPRERINNGH